MLSRLFMKNSSYFWVSYSAAWLAYAVSLGAAFLVVGYPFDLNLLLQVLCNVVPAYLLGIFVIKICQKLKWNERKQPQFTLAHILFSIFFAASWSFLTLLDLSVLTYLQRGVWNFTRWGIATRQWQFFSGLMVYLAIASAVYVKQINENLQVEERRSAELQIRAVRAEAARATAELAALRNQLNPHFLFNTLHSLMTLVRTDAETAEEAIERFALMLRYVLHSQDEKQTAASDVAFADEWNFVQNYLELERLRLGDRLRLTTEIEPAAFEYQFPAFSLQPIVENAIKHAIALRADGGKLYITAQTENDNLLIKVGDDGAGISDNKQNGRGLGLRLVRESLAARFGEAASLTTVTTSNEGFAVIIKIPRTRFSDKNSATSAN